MTLNVETVIGRRSVPVLIIVSTMSTVASKVYGLGVRGQRFGGGFGVECVGVLRL